jgi:uncharacterized membrane protein
MPTQAAKIERAAAENIDAILRLEKQADRNLALHHRAFHTIGGFFGTARFILMQCIAVSLWIGFNLQSQPALSTNIPSHH